MAPIYRTRRRVAVVSAVMAAIYTLRYTRHSQGPKSTTSLYSHVDSVLGYIAVFLKGYGNKNWVRNSCFSGKRRHLEGMEHHRDDRTPRPEAAKGRLSRWSYATSKSHTDVVHLRPHAELMQVY